VLLPQPASPDFGTLNLLSGLSDYLYQSGSPSTAAPRPFTPTQSLPSRALRLEYRGYLPPIPLRRAQGTEAAPSPLPTSLPSHLGAPLALIQLDLAPHDTIERQGQKISKRSGDSDDDDDDKYFTPINVACMGADQLALRPGQKPQPRNLSGPAYFGLAWLGPWL
jgi:hypothetical protein